MATTVLSTCRICGSAATPAGVKRSEFSGRTFQLGRCGSCGFAFVADPRVDYAALYDFDYYRGRGADPLVDYVYESEHPNQTIRRYEWEGVWQAVGALLRVDASTRWLDYGCGTGGLVRHAIDRGAREAVGYEEGWAVQTLDDQQIPHLTRAELDGRNGSFDVITAVEVLEHVIDPVGELARLRALLRPGGLLWVTTSNAEPYRHQLEKWSYVVPDVHISFYEPATLDLAMRKAGFETTYPGFGPGWDRIIQYKVLKALRRKAIHPVQKAVPWALVARAIDRRMRLSAQPVGWAPS